jgi:hypothetical protein
MAHRSRAGPCNGAANAVDYVRSTIEEYMRRLITAFAALTLLSSSALASGGLSCEVADQNLNLTVESGVTHGMGGPFFNFKASAEVLVKDTPPSLVKLNLDNGLVHHWLDGQRLDLSFYRESEGSEPHAEVEIIVQTTQGEEGTTAGEYTLSVFLAEPAPGAENPIKVTGKVSCFVE